MAIDLKMINETMVRTCPELYEVRDGQLYAKFDEMTLFWSPDAESNVCQYCLKGRQVLWIRVEGPRILGEFNFNGMIGLIPLKPM